MSIQDTLNSREATHGNYADHARITQKLKDAVEDELGYRFARKQPALKPTQLETLDMILHKIGRIIAGDPNNADHWHDIAGYATLCENEIIYGNPVPPKADEAIVKKVNDLLKVPVLDAVPKVFRDCASCKHKRNTLNGTFICALGMVCVTNVDCGDWEKAA